MIESFNVAAVYAATVLSIGACTAAWLLQATGGAPTTPVGKGRPTGTVLTAAAILLILSLAGRLLTHATAVFGFPASIAPDSLALIGLQSRWGGGWRLQMTAALAATAAAVWHRRADSFWSRCAASLAAAAVAFALPLSGHAAGSATRIAIAGIHVLGAGLWIGTLAVLLLPGTTSSPSNERDLPAALFKRFSPLAIAGVSAIGATGLWMVWLYAGPVATIVHHPYGRMLVGKLVLFGVVSLCGFLNWRRARFGEPPPAARWEVAAAALLLLVTGFLTQTSPP